MDPTRKVTLIFAVLFAWMLVPSLSAQQALEPDQLQLSSSASARGGYAQVQPRFLGVNSSTAAVATAGAPDTVVTFSGSYVTGPKTARQHWSFTMIGHSPSLAATTTINAPIIPVSLDLRNANGTPRFVNGHRLFYDVTPFIAPLLASPMFQNARYSSSTRATQFQDAVQRAEFFHRAQPAWHTLLKPVVKRKRVMTLLAGSYKFATKSDGSCCAYVLVDFSTFAGKLLPPNATDTKTVVGAALHAGDITTKELATFFFPNTFLFSGTQNFFIVGFHTFLSEPGNALNGNRQKRFILDFSSWVTPFIFFGDAFQDVTPVSHEVAESVNDPFLGNTTPWWMAPNGQCQNVLETGDVVEDLPNATFPVVLKGKTYHPQNEALLEWFERQKPSHALDGAYSYPDEKLLMSLSPLEKPGCP